MRMRVVFWLLGGAALLVSFTNELVGVSANLALGLQQVRGSGPIGLNAVAFITSTAGRVLLLVVALLFLQQAGKDPRGRSTLKSVIVWGVRSGWRAVRQRLAPRTATQVVDTQPVANAGPKPPR
jgi:hypothetical protein